MSNNAPSLALHYLWIGAQVAAVAVTLISFIPSDWIASLTPDAATGAISFVLDYRLLAFGVGLGVMGIAVAVRMRKREQAVAPGIPVATAIDDKPSIAVLPFVNISSDAEKEYFADGMTEDIINGLSCDSRLFVIARNSTFAYKGTSPDIRAVGKELGVRYVLEGSIRPVSDRLRITVQLVETATGTHVWSDKIDRPAAELFAIMDDVVNGLVTALCSNLGIAEAKRASRRQPEYLQAWALCVQAEAFSLQHGPQAAAAEEALLRQATKIEPGYALSWALLAKLAGGKMLASASGTMTKVRDEALGMAEKARHLAPDDPQVLGYCGFAFVLTGKSELGVDCLERSLELNPNNSKFRLYYGFALWAVGKSGEGIRQLDTFLRLSPKDPHLGLAYAYYANCYLAMDEFQKAEEASRKAIQLLPGYMAAYLVLALTLTALGRTAEARQLREITHKLNPAWTPRNLEAFWRGNLKDPRQVEKFIGLLHRTWTE